MKNKEKLKYAKQFSGMFMIFTVIFLFLTLLCLFYQDNTLEFIISMIFFNLCFWIIYFFQEDIRRLE